MKTRRIFVFAIITSLMVVIAAVWRFRNLLFTGRAGPDADRPMPDRATLDLEQYEGLSEAEAAARRSEDISQDEAEYARQVRREIWRTSTFSIFNLGMLGLAIAQTLLGDPLSALLTVGVLILNIALTAGQQLYATSQVEKLLEQGKPMATAMRSGRIRSLPSDEIVIDDVLVAGPGDEFLASGVLLGGSPVVLTVDSGEDLSKSVRNNTGDSIVAGSYCVQDRAIFRVTALPKQVESENWSPVQSKADWTPLQRIMARILRLLLVLIVLFLAMLVLDMANLPVIGWIFEADYRETASVFFSIAPSSLYFMIVVTYALGSVRLGDFGALVRDSRAVESLAQISVLCLSKTGVLTGAEVTLEMAPVPAGQTPLAETRVRQILGDIAFSMPADNIYFQAIRASFKGERRPLTDEAPYLSAYGWRAVTFAESDLRGTYVIGEPAVLEPFVMTTEIVAEDDPDPAETESRLRSGLQRGINQIGGIFRRDDTEAAPNNNDLLINPESGNSIPASEAARAQSDRGMVTAFRNLRLRLGRANQENQEEMEPEVQERPELFFAYYPDPQPLTSSTGQPSLPSGLIPLGMLHFQERLRPEAQSAIQSFVDAGVQIKILSSDAPERVLATAVELGLVDTASALPPVVSGFELSQLPDNEFEEGALLAPVFANLTSNEKTKIIRGLQAQGERVAMVGDSVEDLGAMGAANLALTLHSSSQATLGVADIVLLEDSFDLLPAVLAQGQRIVNGMLDILKINLAQIGYVLLLIIAMILADRRIFYYHPTQGGIVAFFTVVVPSLGLTFFASSGAVPRQYMRSRMFHFVVPAALTMTAAALVISRIFGQGVVDITYSQLAVTHGLILIGLLLVIFVQPPSRFWVGGDVLSKDRRTTYMAVILLGVFIIATYLPLTQELFRLLPLQGLVDYTTIVLVAFVWLFLIRAIWRAPWLSRYVGIVSKQLERD
jgi:magnesium-transporting ATPase (P-type)